MTMILFRGGPYDARQLDLNLDVPVGGTFGIEIDQFGNASSTGKPFALADYRIADSAGTAEFQGIRNLTDGEQFLVEFNDGPARGAHQAPVPAPLTAEVMPMPLLEDGSLFTGRGQIKRIAIYQRQLVGGRWLYFFKRIDDSPAEVANMINAVNQQIKSGVSNQSSGVPQPVPLREPGTAG